MLAAGWSVKTRVAVTSFVLLCASFILTAFSAKHPSVGRFGVVLIGEILGPVQSVLTGGIRGTAFLWENYLALVQTAQQNEFLLSEVQELREQISEAEEIRQENARLRGLLNVLDDGRISAVASRVIGYDPSGWVKSIVIDKGTKHGIGPGMAAIEGRGVVGQVVYSSTNVSRVLLITDHSSGVDAIVQASRTRGVVEGLRIAGCRLKFVLNDDLVRTGDRIVTSGMGGVFPKGLVIGTVSDVERSSGTLFQRIEVKPAVDLTKIEEVLVVTSPVTASAQEIAPQQQR